MQKRKDAYKTIDHFSEGLFKDRGSKFISLAYPVESESAIKEVLNDLRKNYHDARHHCYAWRLGISPPQERANDDGEPSNSAGKPILNQIQKYDLTNTLIVVIRYFGGTLLGVGGLINAYRTAAEAAVNNNKIVKKFLMKTYKLDFDYAQMNQVMNFIKENKLEAFDQIFELKCGLKFKVKLSEQDKIESKLSRLNDIYYEDI